MTISIVKQKAKSKASNIIDAVVLRYVENRLALESKLAKLASLQKAVEADEKDLLEYVDTLVGASEGTALDAGQYVVKVGARGRKAIAFNNEAIKAEIGADVYDAIAEFKIEDLKKYMTGAAFEAAVTYGHVNKRKVTVEEAEQK